MNAILKVIARIAETNIAISNNTACGFWSYQPKVPKNIKNFKKYVKATAHSTICVVMQEVIP